MKKFFILFIILVISKLMLGQMICQPTLPNMVSNHDFNVTNYQIPTPHLMGMGDHVCAWDSLFGSCFYYNTSNNLHYVMLSPNFIYNSKYTIPAGISQNINIIKGQKYDFHIDITLAPPAEKNSYDSVLIDSLIVCFTNANSYFTGDSTTIGKTSQDIYFSKKIIFDTSHIWVQRTQMFEHLNLYANNILADSNYSKLLIYIIENDTSMIGDTSIYATFAATCIFSVNLDLKNPFGAFAGYDKTICRHEPVRLGGDPIAWGGVTPYTYLWTSIPTGFTSNSPNPIVIPNQNTSYVLEVDAHDTNANQISAFDTMNIIVNQSCLWPHWPQLITQEGGNIEYIPITCDTNGNVAIFFCYDYCSITPITIGGDTTFPSFAGENSIASFNKNGQLLWYNALDIGYSCLITEPQSDLEGNIYFLFSSQNNYAFYSGESGGSGQWAMYLVKINKFGIIQWVQSFSPQNNNASDFSIWSYCNLGNNIFLYGYANSHATLGEQPPLDNTGEFICKLNKNNGEVLTTNVFKNDIRDGGSLISINNHNLLSNEGDQFYLFDTNCYVSKIQSVNNFSSSLLTQDGNNKFIASQTSKIMKMSLNSNDSVKVDWSKSYLYSTPLSLFTTSEYIYFNLDNDSIYRLGQDGRLHLQLFNSKGVRYICGATNLSFAYTIGPHTTSVVTN